MNTVSSEMDYKKLYEEVKKENEKLRKESEIVEKQRERARDYYHKNKSPEMLNRRNEKQRDYYQQQKEYYKMYNKYRNYRRMKKIDEFISKFPYEYNELIKLGRVKALKEAEPVQVQAEVEAPVQAEE